MTATGPSVTTVAGLEPFSMLEPIKRIQTVICHERYRPAVASIATRRPTPRHEFLPVKGNPPVSTIPGPDFDCDGVYHCAISKECL